MAGNIFRKCFWSYLKVKNDCSEGSNATFSLILCKFSSDEVETVFTESKSNSRKEIGFEATLKSKTNVLSIWKGHFLIFCKFLNDEVKTIFCKIEAKHKNCLHVNLVIGNFFEIGFEANLDLINKCSEDLKRAFFSFLQTAE